jgi:1-acyl-sn-glycerol-3-phosphate acyltransferase
MTQMSNEVLAPGDTFVPEHALVPSPHFYNAVASSLKGGCAFLGGFNYSGGEHLPRENKSFILAPNHDTMFETMLAPEAVWLEFDGAQVFTPAKDKFWKHPKVGGTFESLGAFPVDRTSDVMRQKFDVEQHFADLVKKAAIIMTFFQMTRRNHRKGEVSNRSLKPSSGLLVAKHNLQVVPAGVSGPLFPYVYLGEPFSFGQHNLNTDSKNEVLEFHKSVLKPIFRDEVQPRMQDAVDESRKRRKELIKSVPRRFLWRALHSIA